MTWVNIGVAAVGVVGGAMGSKGSTSETSNKQELDPRMQKLLYEGSGSGGGLVGDAMQNYQTQRAQGGLNPMQRSGMEMQRQTLMDPGYAKGYDQMRNVGMGLLGSPVAGNPFTTGAKNGNPFQSGSVQAPPAQSQQFTQNPQMQAAYQPMQMPDPYSAPAAPAQSNPLEEYLAKLKKEQEYQFGEGSAGGWGSDGGGWGGMSA